MSLLAPFFPSAGVTYAAHVLLVGSIVTAGYTCRARLAAGARLAFGDGHEDVLARERRESVLIGLLAGGAVTVAVTFVGLPLLVALAFGAVFAFATPVVVRKRRRERYLRGFDAALGESLQTVASSLKAGLTLKDSLRVATDSATPQVKEQVGRALKEYRFGVPIETALDGVRRRVPTANANIAFGAMIVSSRLGGRLPEILKDIVTTIRERERVEGKLRALTAQGRAQSAILMAAPPLMGIGLYFYDPSKMQLLTDYWVGQILLAVAIVLEIVGIVVTRRIMKLEV
jgi:tight adherence protein B